jgi:transposase InsO family protein
VSRFRFIAAEKAQHPVAVLCRVLAVSTSGFYAWGQRPVAARTQANDELTSRIRQIHQTSRGTYGAPRVQAELRAQGARVTRKRVARLMRRAHLVGCRPRPFVRTTIADPTAATSPDLVQRNFTAPAPDRLWLTDITYIPTAEGWLYLAAIVDAFSRRVVGWAMADHLRTELASAALAMAVRARRPPAGLIHHSDRGCQYTAAAYGALLAQYSIRPSLGQPGTCWDNAVAESFFATLKTELLHRQHWPTRQAARSAIFEYIEGWYNRRRRHSTLGYLSPADLETLYQQEGQAA